MATQSQPTYTRADFLTARQMAKKFELGLERVQAVMMRLYKGSVYIDGKTPYIIKTNNKKAADSLSVHPLAIEKVVHLVKTGEKA